MQAYQQRVIDERDELNTKLEKLNAFIGGEVFSSVQVSEQQRLMAQGHAMSIYLHILNERIANFKE